MGDRPASIRALDDGLRAAITADESTEATLGYFEIMHADLLGEHEDLKTARHEARRDLEEIREAYRTLGYPVPILEPSTKRPEESS